MNEVDFKSRDETGATGGASQGVRVVAPARLHLGLLDLAGDLGRRFGSIGLSVERPLLDLTVRHAGQFSVRGGDPERIARYVGLAADLLGVDPALKNEVAIVVDEAMPSHAGFGSGTQLALSLAAALARIGGVRFDAARIASGLDRGARSGIGLTAFLKGGFVVDGGRGANSLVPPTIARLTFPRRWRVILILDHSIVGVHGPEEIEAFRALPPLPSATAAWLCRLAMMKMLPALIEEDIADFGGAVTEIQERLGDYFAPAQGGRRFVSPAVSEAMAVLRAAGSPGVGQSSWGPTGFALAADEAEAKRLVNHVVMNCHTASGLQFLITRGRNRGALITPASSGDTGALASGAT